MIIKLALCQMMGDMKKEKSLDKAEKMIKEAAKKGSNIIALPEMFNCPYSNKYFREFAEDDNGQTVSLLSSLAKELNVYIIGGSIAELSNDLVYNTSYSFNREGKIIGKHRKIHLFDIDVKGGITFKESDTLTAGDSTTIIDTEYGKVGVAICYDVRFPELFRKMALAGAKLIVLPAAFNMTTGPAHWDITMRVRALDNQIYFAAVSPARDLNGPYQAYGGSCVVNPWGEFCAKTDSKETIVYADIDTDYIDTIRDQLPLLKHRRPELY
ncbi:carbon-nitrogen hydrolase family protein [Anaerovorax odorimutans]|uniref:carbon-nitrogen hydrolase family protein n=1 Tax=Anaerovorax odorimutans TaxID=109327 RepID=UPI00040A7A17|nr:carbon-nitrogen hydrolase family protein [Anaerovorax odorimutans]